MLLTISQAFHWFADHTALAEIHRVLKPGGWLGLIWNFEDVSKGGWHSRVWVLDVLALRFSFRPNLLCLRVPLHCKKDLYRDPQYEDGLPQYHTQKWRSAFENQSLFSTPLGEYREPWDFLVPKHGGVWRRIESLSFVYELEEDRKQVRLSCRF